jgi:hypothetical protein
MWLLGCSRGRFLNLRCFIFVLVFRLHLQLRFSFFFFFFHCFVLFFDSIDESDTYMS